MVLLYFLYYNQTDPVKSLRLGMGIIAIVLLSLIKNISVIFVITIKDAYIKFRTWFHKKINHKGRRRRRLREEAKKRTEEEQKKKEDRDLLRYGIIIDRTDPEIFNSDNMMNIPSATIVTSTQRLSNLVQEIKSKNKDDLKISKRTKMKRETLDSYDKSLTKYKKNNHTIPKNKLKLETIQECDENE